MEDRVTNLEIKIAFVEKHVEELDELVRRLVGSVERLQSEMAALSEAAAAQGREGSTSLLDEKPPHY